MQPPRAQGHEMRRAGTATLYQQSTGRTFCLGRLTVRLSRDMRRGVAPVEFSHSEAMLAEAEGYMTRGKASV
jgi:hypothetical protein